MWPPPLTKCECESAGFCPRHRCEKTYEWVLLCRLNEFEFNRWENGEGPCLEQMRAELERLQSGQKPFADLPPCRHRGLEPIEHVDCEICGGRIGQVPVYSCAHFGRCTPRRYGTRTEAMRAMPACIRCDKYEAAESASPDIVSSA